MTFPRTEDCRRVSGTLQDILAEFEERVRAEIVAVAGAATANGLEAREAMRCATTTLMALTAICARHCDDATASGDAAGFLELAAGAIEDRRPSLR